MRSTERPTIRSGSIYVMTIITVAAITSIVLIGISLRNSFNSKALIIEQQHINAEATLSSSEYAIAQVLQDKQWATTAQSGKVFSDFTLGETTYTAAVTDTDTSTTPTYGTTSYHFELQSVSGIADERTAFDVEYTRFDYASFIDSMSAISYWPLNEYDSPTTAEDALFVRDGTYQKPEVAAATTNEEGAPVPEFNDAWDHVEVPWSGNFRKNNGSISMWIYHTNTNALDISGIFGCLYDSWGSAPTISIFILNNALIAYVDEDGDYDYGQFAITSANKIKLNQWHHILVNFGNTYGLQIYVDGQLEAQNTGNTEGIDTAAYAFGGRQPFRIGSAFGVYSSYTTNEGFKGSIAHVAFLEDSLTADQAAEIAKTVPDDVSVDFLQDTWVGVFD